MFTSEATTFWVPQCLAFFSIQRSPPTSPLKYFCLHLPLFHWTQHCTHVVSSSILFFYGATDSWPGPLHYRGYTITDTQHSVGLI